MHQGNTSLGIETETAERLIAAASDKSPVSGLTHTYYRYPARFSPNFVREVISTFTHPGDLVLDPFMGGGTTLVEAMAAGRRAIGCDISSLAAFLTQVKTKIYDDRELASLQYWANDVGSQINMKKPVIFQEDWIEQGYLRNMECQRTWRITKALQQALGSADLLEPQSVEDLARCAILRAAQWALDARKVIPTVQQFRERIELCAEEMVGGALELRHSAEAAFPHVVPDTTCLHRPAGTLHEDEVWNKVESPKLILTSPPYPGVHVLYHRWQVDGRKETPAPFWIANKLDGAGEKYYTLGHRKEMQLRTYYKNLSEAFRSLRKICTPSTMVVQVVAFSEPEWQLPRYLGVMEESGFTEANLTSKLNTHDGRLWRTVPNRRWHAEQLGETAGSREVVLFHLPFQC